MSLRCRIAKDLLMLELACAIVALAFAGLYGWVFTGRTFCVVLAAIAVVIGIYVLMNKCFIHKKLSGSKTEAALRMKVHIVAAKLGIGLSLFSIIAGGIIFLVSGEDYISSFSAEMRVVSGALVAWCMFSFIVNCFAALSERNVVVHVLPQ